MFLFFHCYLPFQKAFTLTREMFLLLMAHSFPRHLVSPGNSWTPLISPFFSSPFLSPWICRVSRTPQNVIPQSHRPDVHTLSSSYSYMFPDLAPEANSGISSPGNSSSLYLTSYSSEYKCTEPGLCRQESLSWSSETFLHREPLPPQARYSQ